MNAAGIAGNLPQKPFSASPLAGISAKMLLCLFCFGFCMGLAPKAQAQNKKRTILQGFWWDFKNNNYPAGWANYLADLAPRLKQAGITAVWVPVSSKNSNPASVGYSPFDRYDLGDKFQQNRLKTPFGDKDEFLRMVAVLHANGIEVIQDVVLNHQDGAGSAAGKGGLDTVGRDWYNANRASHSWPADGTLGFKNFRYVSWATPATDESAADYGARSGRWPMNWQNFNPNPADARYTGSDGSNTTFGPDIAWDNAGSIGLSSVSSYNPVQASDYNRNNGRAWMTWLKKQTGVDGWRFDAVKHFPASIAEDYLWNLQNAAGFASGTDEMFAVGEWVGGKSELDAWCNSVQNRAGTFDFGTRGFGDTPGLYRMVNGQGGFDLSTLPATQQDQRFRTVPFVNNHDTFRPSQASPGLTSNGNYPTDTSGNMVHWGSGSELAPNIDPREPRLAAAYAFASAIDGNVTVFFEDLFDVGTTGKRFTHHPGDSAELPVRADIANITKCRTKFNWEAGAYKVPASRADHLVIERSGKAIIGINDNWNTWQADWITTDFAAGTRLKDYGGSSGATDIRVVAADRRVQISTPPCNGSARRKGYSIWAPEGTNIDAPLTTPSVTNIQEWELADDLGDSNPKSLMQGGALPARSKAMRTAGKVFAKAGTVITYKMFPSRTTTPITVYLGNACAQPLDSISGTGTLTKNFTVPADAWYVLQARNRTDTAASQRVWINVTYTAPQSISSLTSQSFIPTSVDLGADRNVCESSFLNAFIANGYTYQWTVNGFTGSANSVQQVTQSGYYKVVKTNVLLGCTATDSVLITMVPKPVAPVVRASADSLVITNPESGVTYQWLKAGNPIAGATDSYVVVGQNSTYSVRATNAAGCTTLVYVIYTATGPMLNRETVLVSPNPSAGNFNLDLEGINAAEARIQIYTLDGRMLRDTYHTTNAGNLTENLDLGNAPTGLYLLRVSAGGKSTTVKLGINK